MGVVRCMIENSCLPSVVSGTSGGSIVAAFMAIHTNEELLGLINPRISNLHKPHRWFDSPIHQAIHFAKHGYIIDFVKFDATVKAYFGLYTFEEAYRRTNRPVNICIVASSRGRGSGGGSMTLLNHLTAPRVLVYSAVVASCALPGLAAPVTLMSKASDGSIVPYLANTTFVDGSLKADIPTQRLSELFNATQFVGMMNG
jgi:TAG lipase/steryl ester hydrolase/phospholipase A2/LPA acyltransferase